MVVGILRLELHLPENASLKGKRQTLRSLKDRIRNRYNVAVAEVEHQDLWQRAVLGVVCVSVNGWQADQMLNQVLNFVEQLNQAIVTDYDIELTHH